MTVFYHAPREYSRRRQAMFRAANKSAEAALLGASTRAALSAVSPPCNWKALAPARINFGGAADFRAWRICSATIEKPRPSRRAC